MKKLFGSLLLVLVFAGMIIGCGQNPQATAPEENTPEITTEGETVKSNLLTAAVVWKKTAAEYEALYYQAFNLARDKVAQALAAGSDKPLAIITDVDDTIALHNAYWARLVEEGEEFFDDPIWDEYIIDNGLTAAPGALELLNYCKENGVEVFYVTNRDQGDGTYEYAMENLKQLGFPYVDKDHLFVQIDTSNKEDVQKQIAETHEIICFMGDSLNDFQRKYYVKDVDERRALLEEDKDLYGEKYIILPNPTDGHWIRAIFGESEPSDTAENRALWADTAKQGAWK